MSTSEDVTKNWIIFILPLLIALSRRLCLCLWCRISFKCSGVLKLGFKMGFVSWLSVGVSGICDEEVGMELHKA